MSSLAGCSPSSGEPRPTCTATDEVELAAIAEAGEYCGLIVEDSDLSNLDALGEFSGVTDVRLQRNPLLDDISALAQSLAVTTFFLEAHESPLTVLDVPPGASGVGLWATDTETLSGQDATMQITLNDLTDLKSISFPITTSAQISLEGLGALASIEESFPVLLQVTGLVVRNCPLLPSSEIEAFRARVIPDAVFEHCGNLDDDPC